MNHDVPSFAKWAIAIFICTPHPVDEPGNSMAGGGGGGSFFQPGISMEGSKFSLEMEGGSFFSPESPRRDQNPPWNFHGGVGHFIPWERAFSYQSTESVKKF